MSAFYQSLKPVLLNLFGISKDAAHISVGLLSFFLWLTLFRQRVDSFKSVLPVVALALLMEFLDFQDMFEAHRPFLWHASLHDLLVTTFWPLVIVVVFKLWGRVIHR